MSYDQFIEEEKAPNELLIAEIGSDADIKIQNNGTIEEFDSKIEEICENVLSSRAD